VPLPRGRPALTRGVVPLDSILAAPVVAIDTSAVVSGLLEDQPAHAEYADFLERASEQSVTLAFCDLLELELAQACFRIAIARRHEGQWRQHLSDRRSRRPARDLASRVFGRWSLLLDATPHLRVGISDELGAGLPSPRLVAFSLMSTYAIGSYDAVHAAVALLLGAPIVTADSGFARCATLEMYTHGARVGYARSLRGGRATR
jgi:predicted nucleic acid-binding protein